MDFVCASIISFAAFIVVVLLVVVIALGSMGNSSRGQRTYGPVQSAYSYNPALNTSYGLPSPQNLLPALVFHGTKTFQNAMSIVSQGWLINYSKTIWITSDFNTARGYGNFIVECHVGHNPDISVVFTNVYTAELPYAHVGSFCHIRGIMPRRILKADTRSQIYP